MIAIIFLAHLGLHFLKSDALMQVARQSCRSSHRGHDTNNSVIWREPDGHVTRHQKLKVMLFIIVDLENQHIVIDET